jgi:tRNA A-37 threonylcarbamoyl transferase component Bud32
MESAGVVRLFPAGTRFVRLFAERGAAALPGWDDAGMKLCKSRSRGRAVCGNGVFLKEYVYTSAWERFRRRFMALRPFVSLAAARKLEELKIPTPRVLAAVRGVSPNGDIRDLLVTAELASDVRFGDKIAAELGDARVDLARELVPVVFGMHEGGMIHGDLSMRNWYRLPDGAWGLIDLDGAKVSRGRVSERARTDELARLASSCFVCATRAEDGTAELLKFIRVFSEAYRASGGAVAERRFEARSRFLADRFRVRYLNMDALK